MAKCPHCDYVTPEPDDGDRSVQVWQEVAHMQLVHHDIILERLHNAGLDMQAGFTDNTTEGGSMFQYRREHPRPLDNEGRADWAEQAIANGCDAEAEQVDPSVEPSIVYQDVSDVLANIIHFCHRAGIDWEDVVEHAERAAEGDLEDGPEAERDTERFPSEVPLDAA